MMKANMDTSFILLREGERRQAWENRKKKGVMGREHQQGFCANVSSTAWPPRDPFPLNLLSLAHIHTKS